MTHADDDAAAAHFRRQDPRQLEIVSEDDNRITRFYRKDEPQWFAVVKPRGGIDYVRMNGDRDNWIVQWAHRKHLPIRDQFTAYDSELEAVRQAMGFWITEGIAKK